MKKLPTELTRRDLLKKIPEGIVAGTALLLSNVTQNEAHAEGITQHRIAPARKLLETLKKDGLAHQHILKTLFSQPYTEEHALHLLATQESTMYKPREADLATLKKIPAFQNMQRTLKDGQYGVFVNADTQRIYLVAKRGSRLQVAMAYKTSTSSKLSGNIPDSNRTPVGNQKVTSSYTGVLGQVVAAEPIPIELFTYINNKFIVSSLLSNGGRLGERVSNRTHEHAVVLTARLTIDAQRGIHIHGTNRVDTLGERASGGCIRMSNVDITHLMIYISINALVVIHDAQAIKPPRHRPKRIHESPKPMYAPFDF